MTIGNSVTDIGHSAFCRCYKLVEIYNLSSLTITAGSSNYGYVGCYALNVYTNTEGQKKTFETEDGYIFYEDGDVRYLLRYKGDKVELTLPKDCNGKNYAIYKYAFYENNKIIKVIIPNSVTSIGGSAFEDCTSLTSVTLGNSVTSIGDGAFAYCTSLTSIIIPDSVTSIGNSAFESCTSLTSIIIPDSVTSIGNSAFESCTSLTSVYYNGTAEAWNNIEIGYNNYYLSYATRYYYSESEPTEEGNFWHYDENGEVAVW
ncbi:MAG: leucine-rich repeat domain-containing protein [Clostridia bacterium]|nr:leucine-rich repeat domain-containing protein [Clostridia bacterium]